LRAAAAFMRPTAEDTVGFVSGKARLLVDLQQV
jgi:hypothetical protein